MQRLSGVFHSELSFHLSKFKLRLQWSGKLQYGHPRPCRCLDRQRLALEKLHVNSSVRKAGLQENSWEVVVNGACIPPWINMLAGLLSSCISFQDQKTMKTLEILVSKIRVVQVFKRHQGTGSLLEPKRWGKHCKCVFLSTAMENKWLSVAKYQWIRELRPTAVKPFSCGMLFLRMLNPSGWINYMLLGRNFLDNRDLALQAFILWISYGRVGHCKFPPHSLII